MFHGLCELARLIRARVSAVGEQLTGLTGELGLLLDEFQAPSSWDDIVISDGSPPGTLKDLRLLVAETLRQSMPKLAEQLDREFQAEFFGQHGGLSGVIQKDIDLRGTLPAALRRAARTAVSGVLRQIDLAKVLLSEDEQPQQMSPSLVACLQAAMPKLAACGAAKRLLLVCPKRSTDALLEEFNKSPSHTAPTVVSDSDGDLILCYEVQGLPIARVATALIGSRHDYVHVASRFHTRVDVAWSSLAEIG